MKLPPLGLPNGTACTVTGLNTINVIVGKNGCGKSSILKSIDTQAPSSEGSWGKIKYITPERGGTLTYEAGIDLNITRDPTWMSGTRRTNQTQNFRQQSVAQFRILELAVLRKMEKDVQGKKPIDRDFDSYVTQINTLLARLSPFDQQRTTPVSAVAEQESPVYNASPALPIHRRLRVRLFAYRCPGVKCEKSRHDFDLLIRQGET